jgi:hypothetical protein
MTGEGTTGHDARRRAMALALAFAGLALAGYVEFRLAVGASDRFGWFVYEAAAWLAVLCIGPFVPVGSAVLLGALAALGLEGWAYWHAIAQADRDGASFYLWKPLAQLLLIGGAWFGGYLHYLRRLRERAHG